jgi:hypothetical protein
MTEPLPFGAKIRFAFVVVVEIVVAAPEAPVICKPRAVWTEPVPFGDKTRFAFVVVVEMVVAEPEPPVICSPFAIVTRPVLSAWNISTPTPEGPFQMSIFPA